MMIENSDFNIDYKTELKALKQMENILKTIHDENRNTLVKINDNLIVSSDTWDMLLELHLGYLYRFFNECIVFTDNHYSTIEVKELAIQYMNSKIGKPGIFELSDVILEKFKRSVTQSLPLTRVNYGMFVIHLIEEAFTLDDFKYVDSDEASIIINNLNNLFISKLDKEIKERGYKLAVANYVVYDIIQDMIGNHYNDSKDYTTEAYVLEYVLETIFTFEGCDTIPIKFGGQYVNESSLISRDDINTIIKYREESKNNGHSKRDGKEIN